MYYRRYNWISLQSKILHFEWMYSPQKLYTDQMSEFWETRFASVKKAFSVVISKRPDYFFEKKKIFESIFVKKQALLIKKINDFWWKKYHISGRDFGFVKNISIKIISLFSPKKVQIFCEKKRKLLMKIDVTKMSRLGVHLFILSHIILDHYETLFSFFHFTNVDLQIHNSCALALI